MILGWRRWWKCGIRFGLKMSDASDGPTCVGMITIRDSFKAELKNHRPQIVNRVPTLAELAQAEVVVIGLSSQSPLISSKAKQEGVSPNIAGICKLFMSADTYESFVGDLEERYAVISKTKGHRSAQLWFWRQVFQSLFPLVIAAIRRVSGFEKLMGLYWRKKL